MSVKRNNHEIGTRAVMTLQSPLSALDWQAVEGPSMVTNSVAASCNAAINPDHMHSALTVAIFRLGDKSSSKPQVMQMKSKQVLKMRKTGAPGTGCPVDFVNETHNEAKTSVMTFKKKRTEKKTKRIARKAFWNMVINVEYMFVN